MSAWGALLKPTDVQRGRPEVHLIPAQVYQLGNPQAVSVGQEDHRGIQEAVAVARGGLRDVTRSARNIPSA